MFRDTKDALAQLEQALMEEEAAAAAESEDEAIEPAAPSQKEPDFHAYNADRTDVDMEEYADRVYHPQSKGCLPLAIMLTLCVIALVLGWLALKKFGIV